MEDVIEGMWGQLKVHFIDRNGKKIDEIDMGKNAISYRAKSIMSRILAAGLTPNDDPTTEGVESKVAEWGSSGTSPLRVTGIALGNGGHLIYNTAAGGGGEVIDGTDLLLKDAADTNGLILDGDNIASDPGKVAMPKISSGIWGYAAQPDRGIPGTTYEKVENGNVPWDGTLNINDNAPGLTQPNTTLYSETFRIPLDDGAASADGYSFPTATEVQFKATLPASFLNYEQSWGFAAQPANWISEAGLIVGYRPDFATLPSGQVYSEDGDEPGIGNGFTFGGEPQSNFGTSGGTFASKEAGLTGNNDTSPQVVVNGLDTFPANNTWNMLARKPFRVITKSEEFSLVFVWTIGF